MPRTISGNGPWTVSSNGGFPWFPAIAAVGVTAVVVVYGHQITRVAHDVLLIAGVVLGVVVVAGTLTGVLVWRWRRGRREAPVAELTEDAAAAIGRDVWPYVRTDGSAIELPERAQPRWN